MEPLLAEDLISLYIENQIQKLLELMAWEETIIISAWIAELTINTAWDKPSETFQEKASE